MIELIFLTIKAVLSVILFILACQMYWCAVEMEKDVQKVTETKKYRTSNFSPNE